MFLIRYFQYLQGLVSDFITVRIQNVCFSSTTHIKIPGRITTIFDEQVVWYDSVHIYDFTVWIIFDHCGAPYDSFSLHCNLDGHKGLGRPWSKQCYTYHKYFGLSSLLLRLTRLRICFSSFSSFSLVLVFNSPAGCEAPQICWHAPVSLRFGLCIISWNKHWFKVWHFLRGLIVVP